MKKITSTGPDGLSGIQAQREQQTMQSDAAGQSPASTEQQNQTETPQTTPPMTPTLLARLFVVPAVLVSILVVGLVVVVVLFGWSSIGQRPPVSELLATLEQSSGARQAGVLMPGDKDVWLAAKELAERLRNRDKEMKPEEIVPTARKLAAMYTRMAAAPTPAPENERNAFLAKQEFSLLALARLATAESSQTLIAALDAREAAVRQAALRGLVEMRRDAGARAGLPKVLAALSDPAAEVRLVACTAVSQLADAADRTAIDALAARLTEDRELQWNAAIGLARMGSPRGKLVLLTMLNRKFWERNRVSYTTTEGRSVERPFTPIEVENYIAAAADAAARLNDAELHAAIGRLKDDPSPQVREQALRAAAKR